MHLEINKFGITDKGDIYIQFTNGDHTLLLEEDLEEIKKYHKLLKDLKEI